jgi:hypothetical protein
MPETEGAPAAAVVPFTSRPNGRWKVIVGTIGAVAASVLIWVAVRDQSPSLDTTSAANRAEQRLPREMGGNAPAPAATRPAEGATVPPPADVSPDAARLQGQQGQQGQNATRPPRPAAKPLRENTARTAEPAGLNAKASAAPVEPSPARPAPPPPAIMPPVQSPVAAAAPPPQAAGAVPRSSTVDVMRSTETFFATAPVIAEFVVGTDLQAALAQQAQAFGGVGVQRRAGGAGGGGGGRGGGAAAGVPAQKAADVLSTGPVRWRLRGASPAPSTSSATLERSNDGGSTWRSVTLPATPLLSGGTAPTNTVCWLVGRGGTVLLSTDGTSFRHVTKPVDADLVSVLAVDARSATVRTADGRTFVTIDGGLTWTSGSDSPTQ